MNIYYSNFANVDLKNETSQGADFTLQEEMRNEYLRRFDNLTQSFKESENDDLNDDFLLDAAFNPFASRSKTDDPKRLQEEMSKVNNAPLFYPSAMIS